MTDNQYVKMVICWKEQQRFVKININDDLNSIQTTISNCFQLAKSNYLNTYQIQFYNNEYQKYIDLYSETFDIFQDLLKRLFSSEVLKKSDQQWTLKIVSKFKEDDTVNELIIDDTYNFQQENDLSRNHSFDETNAIATNQSTENSDEQSTESLTPTTESKFECVRTPEHPYGFGFDFTLALYQRLQFESDMQRKTSSKTTTGGVRLRASQKLNPSSTGDVPYPTLHFEIPTTEHCSDWSLYFYIITQSDNNGLHYLHASKGIFDEKTKLEDKFGAIQNTNLVNPFVVQLTEDDLRDGRYELKAKICNIRNVATLKNNKLREFPRLNKPIIYDDQSLMSKQTTKKLNFSSDKYHLGCILVCNKTARDICISNLTIAGRKRKHNENEQSQHDEDEEHRRKKVRK